MRHNKLQFHKHRHQQANATFHLQQPPFNLVTNLKCTLHWIVGQVDSIFTCTKTLKCWTPHHCWALTRVVMCSVTLWRTAKQQRSSFRLNQYSHCYTLAASYGPRIQPSCNWVPERHPSSWQGQNATHQDTQYADVNDRLVPRRGRVGAGCIWQFKCCPHHQLPLHSW